MATDLAGWIRRLETAANASLGSSIHDAGRSQPLADTWIQSFRDDAGHRRAVDTPFLHHATGLVPTRTPRLASLLPHVDVALWWRVASGPGCPFDAGEIITSSDGPLVPDLHQQPIELWSTAELCALHALSWLGLREPRWRDRTLGAAAWLLANVQPDNATNHPWGVHVFAGMESAGDLEAGLYAQTLLNNALVGRERADRFSACILHDAAQQLAHRSAELRP